MTIYIYYLVQSTFVSYKDLKNVTCTDEHICIFSTVSVAVLFVKIGCNTLLVFAHNRHSLSISNKYYCLASAVIRTRLCYTKTNPNKLKLTNIYIFYCCKHSKLP